MKTAIESLLIRRRTAASVLVLLGALIATAALATGGGTSHRKRPRPPAAAHRSLLRRATVATTVSAAIAAEFPILNQPATAADKLPGDATATWLPEQRVGANAALARRAASGAEGTIYLIPADAGVCMKNTAGTQNICATAEEVNAGDAQEVIACSPSVPSEDIEIGGLLPSDASSVQLALSDGRTTTLALENGTYAARFPRSGPLPQAISWSTSGKRHTAPVAVPADAGGENCQTAP